MSADANDSARTPKPGSPRGPVNVECAEPAEFPVRVVDVHVPGAPLAHPEWLELTRDLAGRLYCAVDAARRVVPPTPIAQHQLIVATAAVAATELESLFALGRVGLHRSAAIHARGVGLLARNAVVFSENVELAQACYDSLEPSRLELSQIAQRILQDAKLEPALERRYADAAGDSMRKLERKQSALFARDEHYLINAFDQTFWSKWNHGDIIALADAGDALRRSDADLHSALNVHPLFTLQLFHASGLSAIVLLAVLAERHFISGKTVVELVNRHRALGPTLNVFREHNVAMRAALGIEDPKAPADDTAHLAGDEA